jgi:DNA invertase Pin-like site-specific DNA recombinase
MRPALELRELRKAYGPLAVLHGVDLVVPTGKLVFHLFASLAEFERNLIRERTQAGLKAARARGKRGGRPQKLQGKELAMAQSLMADPSNDVTEVAKQFRVHRSTLYRRAKNMKPTEANT